jgi:hypothetical protein
MPARLEGLFETQARVNRQIRAAGRATKRELIEFCLQVMGLAARNAPVKDGDLRGGFTIEINGERWAHSESGPSGAVNTVIERTDVPDEIEEIAIYVGTAGVKYAVRQHEELGYRHPKGGGPKFLENALNQMLPMLTQRLQTAAREGARNG